MQMSSKDVSAIKNNLKALLKDKEIMDIVLFGSMAKGKAMPSDVDIAVITAKAVRPEAPGFHISVLKPEDFVQNPPSLIHTLLREGYSLRDNAPFSEKYRFKSRAMFVYSLNELNASAKVKIVNVLHGKANEKGLVAENGGEWIARQVFIVPTGAEHIFEKLFINLSIRFTKSFVLMH